MDTSLCLRFYFVGYEGLALSRRIRRMLAKTPFHRAWLEGYMGSFVAEGRKTSVLDYVWDRVRKGPHHRPAPFAKVLHCLFNPYDC